MRHSLLIVILAALACGAPGEDTVPAGGNESASISSGEPRVPLAPTGADQLPPAIVGQGGELEGTEVRYLPNDPSTVGYLAVPDGPGPFPARS